MQENLAENGRLSVYYLLHKEENEVQNQFFKENLFLLPFEDYHVHLRPSSRGRRAFHFVLLGGRPTRQIKVLIIFSSCDS